MGLKEKLQRVGRYEYLLPAGVLNKRQRAVKFFLSETLYELLEEDAVLQAANAATLPGVVEPVVVMPDVHVGYGFPIGGVMATDPAEGGIISPGAIGYDINCGVRLIATNLEGKDVKKRLDSIMRALLHGVPAGVGSTSKIKLSKSKMKEVLRLGAKWAVSRGFGKKEDLEHAEGYGQLPFADPEAVSNEAYERGSDELGTVGSGNHFVEVQEVEEVYEPEVAKALGFHKGQVMIMVHSGSRGLGHQVATDYIKVALRASGKYRIELPDPELACVPLNSPEGQRYWGAMNAAANYAFANRQILGWISTSAVAKALGLTIEEVGYRVVYDHAHNIGKLEAHRVGGKEKTVLVHRKGATRAFPPGHPEVPPAYREYGQPVIIPGDMGRYSYLLVGQPASMEKSYGTTCHGAGRVLSRAKAKKLVRAAGGVEKYVRERGLKVVARGKGTIMEEIPEAYKDVSEVVKVVAGLGIAKPILRLKPLGTLKG